MNNEYSDEIFLSLKLQKIIFKKNKNRILKKNKIENLIRQHNASLLQSFTDYFREIIR